MQEKLLELLKEQEIIFSPDFIEDCKDLITEAVFTSRWALVEGYWNLGKKIREEFHLKKWTQNEAGRVLQTLANLLNISNRTIYYSLQAFDAYPDIQQLPEGKNITWNKLITKYLPSEDKTKSIVNFPNAIHISVEDIVAYLKRAVYARLYFEETYETYKIDNKMAEEKGTLVAHIKDDKLIIDSEIAEPNPELSDELAERIDNVENDKNVEIIEPNLDKFRTVDLESRLGLEEMKATKKSTLIAKVPPKNKLVPGYISKAEIMAMEFWKRIGGEDTTPDPVWLKREKLHAKRLIKLGLTIENIIDIYDWRIQTDDRGFWIKKLHSLAMIYGHLGDWSLEAKKLPQSFEDFLNKNPHLDYRNLSMNNEHEAYIKAAMCKQSLEMAKKAGVVLTEKNFATLYEASRLRFDVFNKEKK